MPRRAVSGDVGGLGIADQADMARPGDRGSGAGLPAIAHDDPFPAGPYQIGLTQTPRGPSRPYTILAGADRRCVAGHVESHSCAEAIVAALNAQFPP